jgi:hypothetical protein
LSPLIEPDTSNKNNTLDSCIFLLFKVKYALSPEVEILYPASFSAVFISFPKLIGSD